MKQITEITPPKMKRVKFRLNSNHLIRNSSFSIFDRIEFIIFDHLFIEIIIHLFIISHWGVISNFFSIPKNTIKNLLIVYNLYIEIVGKMIL